MNPLDYRIKKSTLFHLDISSFLISMKTKKLHIILLYGYWENLLKNRVTVKEKSSSQINTCGQVVAAL